MTMRLRYEISIDDLSAFIVFHHQQSPTLRRNRLLCVLIVAGVIVGLSLIAAEVLRVREVLWFGIAWAVLFAVVYARSWRRGLSRVAAKLYAEGQNKGMLGTHVSELRDEGLFNATDCYEQTFFWKGIERIESISGYTFAYVSAVSAHILPEHSVVEGSYQAFVDELQRRWRHARDE